MRQIAELMGHSEIQTTMRYAHLQPGHLADALERMVDPQPVQKTDTKLAPELTPAVSGFPNPR